MSTKGKWGSATGGGGRRGTGIRRETSEEGASSGDNREAMGVEGVAMTWGAKIVAVWAIRNALTLTTVSTPNVKAIAKQ